jgi:hypothetical protein
MLPLIADFGTRKSEIENHNCVPLSIPARAQRMAQSQRGNERKGRKDGLETAGKNIPAGLKRWL